MGTDDGLSIYNAAKDSFTHFNDTNTTVICADGSRKKQWGYSVKSIAELPSGDLLIGTWCSGMLRYNPAKRTFRAYDQLNEANSAFTVCTDNRQRVWIGTWYDGIFRLDNAEDYSLKSLKKIAPNTPDFGATYDITASPDGTKIWACTEGGLRYINEKDEVKDLSQMDGIRLATSRRMTKSPNGLLFAITLQGKVVAIRQRDTEFTTFSDPRLIGTYSIYTNDGRHLWLGNGARGIALLDTENGTLMANSQIPGMETLGENGSGVDVYDFLKRKNGELWMAAYERKILVINPDHEIKMLDDTQISGITDNVLHLCEDRNGRIWLGMRKGVTVIHPNGTRRHLAVKKGNLDMTGYWVVTDITQDHKGNIWVGSKSDGLVKITIPAAASHTDEPDPEQFGYKHYTTPQNVIQCFEDSHNQIWVVSPTDGLCVYSSQEDRFVSVSDNLHPYGQKVCAINEDEQGNIWLSTSNGLTRITYDNDCLATVTYTTDDGLPEAAFIPNSTFRYADKLYFGTTEGVVEISSTPYGPETNSMETTSHAPQLSITDILIDGTSLRALDPATAASISRELPAYTHSITLPASVKKLTVDMALLSYQHAETTRYAYLLEGYDAEWQPLPATLRSVTFSRLPAGQYRLHMRQQADASRRFTTVSRSLMAAEASETPNAEVQFLLRAKQLVTDHLDNADYNRESLAADLGISVSTLYTKLRDVTDMSVQNFIQNVRLNAATDILRKEPDIRIQELAFRVGFNTPKYFSQCFKKEFGMLPKEYAATEQTGHRK